MKKIILLCFLVLLFIYSCATFNLKDINWNVGVERLKEELPKYITFDPYADKIYIDNYDAVHQE